MARMGRWTNGPIPFGYDLDAEGQLTPSTRLVESAGMTEADVARELFQRLDAGGTAHAEAQRLNMLKVPTARRYSGGKVVMVGAQCLPSRLSYMLRNPVYRGQHVYKSKHGTMTREVPALVVRDLWERVRERLRENRSLPKGNATRVYLLRGLITCGLCGSTYVGSRGTSATAGRRYYYRCSQRSASNQPEHGKRCRSVALRAAWLEDEVWQECREFILYPEEALTEARRQLDARGEHRGRIEGERHRLQQVLAEHTAARERMLTLLRRGQTTVEETERHLDAIAKEAETIRAQLSALRAQQDLDEANAAHYSTATAMLGRLRERLAEIERTNDVQAKRQVVELLVAHLHVETLPTGRRTKQARVPITYTFIPKRVSHFCTGSIIALPPGVDEIDRWRTPLAGCRHFAPTRGFCYSKALPRGRQTG
jgi:site-specific DNA recombinase